MSPQEHTSNRLLVQWITALVEQLYPDDSALIGRSGLDQITLTNLSRQIIEEVDGWRRGERTEIDSLVTVAMQAASTAHSAFCRGGRSAVGRACVVDAVFAGHLVAFIAALVLQEKCAHPPTPYLVDAWFGRFGPAGPLTSVDARTRVAIETALESGRQPRRLLDLDQGRPRLQVNAPVSRVGRGLFCDNRAAARLIGDEAAASGFDVEVTSDWVDPDDGDMDDDGDALVEAAIYRTAWMVLFEHGGRTGTGETLKLAEQLLIPTLVLRRMTKHAPSRRQRGRMGNREVVVVRSLEEARAAAVAFRIRYATQIFARHSRLMRMSTRGALQVATLHEQVAGLDDSRFETSSVTRERASFFTDDPMHWWQANDELRGAVSRLLGVAPSDGRRSGQPIRGLDTRELVRREYGSFGSLLTAAEIQRWDWPTVRRLVEERRRTAALDTEVLHHRSSPMAYQDWITLAQSIGVA